MIMKVTIAPSRPGSSVRARLSSFRTGARREVLSKWVYVVARTEGDTAWIRDGARSEHRIALDLLVPEDG